MRKIVGFNEKYYLDANIDIKDAIQNKLFKSGIEHLEKHGLKEIKEGVRKFHSNYAPYHETYYLQSFADIRRMIEKRKLSSGFEHFCLFGYHEIITGVREWQKAPTNRTSQKKENTKNIISITDFIKKVRFLTEDIQELPSIKPENINTYNLEELKELTDEQFVDLMYQVILERIPDVDGKNSKLSQLKSGKKRKDIIIDMRTSDEGQKYINNHIILGIHNHGSIIDERILYKSNYNHEDFCTLVAFFQYKFSLIQKSENIINILNHSGPEFVYLLYLSILRREPDFEGFNINTKSSYLLEDKIIKIYDFTRSNEAKSKKSIFYDLSNKDISQLKSYKEINYTNLSKENYDKIKRKQPNLNPSEITFHELFSINILNSIMIITSLTSQPLSNFKKLCDAIFNQQKTILEAIYDQEILNQIRKHIKVIDYFNKPLTKTLNLNNDLLRNIQYFISNQKTNETNLINNFNLNATYNNIESKIIEISKLTKITAHKRDIESQHAINQKAIKEINNLKEILKEHEEKILAFKNTSSAKKGM